MKTTAIAVAAIVLLVSGCATAPPPGPAPDAAELALNAALSSMPGAMHAQAADTKAPAARISGPLLTVRSYIGDAAPLLRRVATARGMTFTVTGPEPRLPLLVSVDSEGATLEAFLQDVGHQFGQRADIVLGRTHIEIRYRGQPN